MFVLYVRESLWHILGHIQRIIKIAHIAVLLGRDDVLMRIIAIGMQTICIVFIFFGAMCQLMAAVVGAGGWELWVNAI